MTNSNKEDLFFNYNKHKLAYKIYGKSLGFPIFVNYGLFGTIELPNDFIKMADNANVKLIILERPGYGYSDLIEMKNVAEWANIVEKFLSYLNISEFGIMGISAGAPYAYSIAYKFPNRITGGVYILSGVPNVLDSAVYAEYSSSHKKYYERYRNNSVQEISKEMKNILTKFKYLFFWSKKRRNAINVGLANNCMGVALVIKHQITDWGFDVYNIKNKIHLWHSKKDSEVPFLPVKKMTDKMQNTRLHIQKENSHFPSKTTIKAMFEIIKTSQSNRKSIDTY